MFIIQSKSDERENLENYIGRIFRPRLYLKDAITNEPIGKGNRYRLRKVFKSAKYASFDDLDDRSADTFKYQRQPIVKIHFDDLPKLVLSAESI